MPNLLRSREYAFHKRWRGIDRVEKTPQPWPYPIQVRPNQPRDQELFFGLRIVQLRPLQPSCKQWDSHLPPKFPACIIAAFCSWNRSPIRSLLLMYLSTHFMTQDSSREMRDLVVKSLTQWSKHLCTNLEYICDTHTRVSLWLPCKSQRTKSRGVDYSHEFLHLLPLHPRVQFSLLCCCESTYKPSVELCLYILKSRRTRPLRMNWAQSKNGNSLWELGGTSGLYDSKYSGRMGNVCDDDLGSVGMKFYCCRLIKSLIRMAWRKLQVFFGRSYSEHSRQDSPDLLCMPPYFPCKFPRADSSWLATTLMLPCNFKISFSLLQFQRRYRVPETHLNLKSPQAKARFRYR